MILTQNQLALENSLRRILPAGVVSCWIPDGYGGAKDIIRGNHGQCHGTHPNVPTIAPPIEQLADCDSVGVWDTTTGGVLSIDTDDKKEGTGSLKNTIASPVENTAYFANYNPAGTWDLSVKEDILFWLYSDRPSTEFLYVNFRISDIENNWKGWNPVFAAGAWTAVNRSLLTGAGVGTVDLASINKIQLGFKVVDDTPFYFKIDDIRVTGKPSVINPSVGWHWDGINDRIVVPNHKSLDITGNEITIGFWIWISVPFNQYDGIIAQADNSRKWTIKGQTDTSAVRLWLNGSGVLISPSFSLCEWHRVMATYDNNLSSNQAKIYIDGDFAVQANRTGAIESIGATDIWIGREATYYVDGYIVLPFVAKRTWSPAQVKNDHLNTKSLFAPRG